MHLKVIAFYWFLCYRYRSIYQYVIKNFIYIFEFGGYFYISIIISSLPWRICFHLLFLYSSPCIVGLWMCESFGFRCSFYEFVCTFWSAQCYASLFKPLFKLVIAYVYCRVSLPTYIKRLSLAHRSLVFRICLSRYARQKDYRVATKLRLLAKANLLCQG